MLDAPAADAFDRVEDFLARNRGLPADLYLGYGLAGAGPPEPCPLPAAACVVDATSGSDPVVARYAVGEWVRTWTPAEHRAAIAEARAAIGSVESAGRVPLIGIVQTRSPRAARIAPST